MTFYCDKHKEIHSASAWRGKPIETKKGIKIIHYCLEQSEQPKYPEFVPQSLQEERVKYANDQLQSHRGGQLSREFIEAHPKQAKQMLKDGAITKEDVKKSKYVWKSDVKGVTKKIDAEALVK